MLRTFYASILGGYDEKTEYVSTKKAQFLFWFYMLFGVLFVFFPLVFLLLDKTDRAYAAMLMAWPQVALLAVALRLLKHKKIRMSANIMGTIAFLIAAAGYLSRPVPLSGVTLAYFMFVALSFGLFFCSYRLAILFYACDIAVIIGNYIFGAVPSLDGAPQLIADAARSQVIDLPVALTFTFIIGMSSTKIVNRALQIMGEQMAENRRQSEANETLVRTIREVSDRLSASIAKTSEIITNFSDNAQSQAASVEELTATIEEISAGTESTKTATDEQNGSVNNLAESIENLSASIDLMETYGQQISIVFDDFLEMAKEGQDSSQKLDSTNREITASSNEILSVVTIIEEFFDKIKMLSLNATIEAARAGEYGRGFAVVAAEIGKLSDDSAKELSQISSLIEKNKQDVEKGNEVITEIITFIQTLLQGAAGIQQKTKDILDEIAKQKSLKNGMNERTEVTKRNAELIALSMSEQKRAIDDVVSSIADTNGIVQKNAENTSVLQQNADEVIALARELTKKFG